MNKLRVGVLGNFQNGKSTLVNCLLGEKVLQTGGDGSPVSFINSQCLYGLDNKVTFENCNKVLSYKEFIDFAQYNPKWGDAIIYCNSKILKNVIFVDTPGFNANPNDTETALRAIQKIDFAILVITNKGTLDESENNILEVLNTHDIPFMVVMNCHEGHGDSWNPSSDFNIDKSRGIESTLSKNTCVLRNTKGECVNRVNVAWYWYGSGKFKQDPEYRQTDLIYKIKHYQKKHKTQELDFSKLSMLDSIIPFFAVSWNPMMAKIKGMVLLHSALNKYNPSFGCK